MADLKESAALEIAKLQQQLSATAGTTLSKLHEIVARNEHSSISSVGYNRKYDRLTREELQRALDEKDHSIQQL